MNIVGEAVFVGAALGAVSGGLALGARGENLNSGPQSEVTKYQSELTADQAAYLGIVAISPKCEADYLQRVIDGGINFESQSGGSTPNKMRTYLVDECPEDPAVGTRNTPSPERQARIQRAGDLYDDVRHDTGERDEAQDNTVYTFDERVKWFLAGGVPLGALGALAGLVTGAVLEQRREEEAARLARSADSPQDTI